MEQPSSQEIEKMKNELSAYEKRGYYLNPDDEFTDGLISGLIVNQKRYGYPLCPCRLTAGSRQEDLDLICPCDYRDADIVEFGNCYCGLYVSHQNALSKSAVKPVKERRPERARRNQFKNN